MSARFGIRITSVYITLVAKRVKRFYCISERFYKCRNVFVDACLRDRGKGRPVVNSHQRMAADAKTRVRSRIRARLDELNMTGRELANAVFGEFGKPKSDAWISGVLSGAQALSLDDLDAVADKLNLPPSELVRDDDSELREIRPHEMRLLRHYQSWPAPIQERWLRILDYFSMVTADAEAAKLLDVWKGLSLRERKELRRLLQQLQSGTIPPGDGRSDDQ